MMSLRIVCYETGSSIRRYHDARAQMMAPVDLIGTMEDTDAQQRPWSSVRVEILECVGHPFETHDSRRA